MPTEHHGPRQIQAVAAIAVTVGVGATMGGWLRLVAIVVLVLLAEAGRLSPRFRALALALAAALGAL